MRVLSLSVDQVVLVLSNILLSLLTMRDVVGRLFGDHLLLLLLLSIVVGGGGGGVGGLHKLGLLLAARMVIVRWSLAAGR